MEKKLNETNLRTLATEYDNPQCNYLIDGEYCYKREKKAHCRCTDFEPCINNGTYWKLWHELIGHENLSH